jgi:hypothetical protein
LDLGEAYTVTSLPSKYDYLLDKRATIEMAMVRGAEGASTDISDIPSPTIQTVSVPNLSVTKSVTSQEGPAFWLKLVKALEEEYAQALKSLDDVLNASNISQAVMSRTSLRTGQRRPYNYDSPLPATTLTLEIVGGVFFFTWTPTYDERFSFYTLERSSTASFGAKTTIIQISIPHTYTTIDTPPVGTWYYRVAVVNNSNLYSYCTPISGVKL